MNFLGRFLLFLLTVLVIVVLTVFLLSPLTIRDWTGNISEISSVVRVVIAVLIDLVLLALLFSQLRPARQQPTSSGLMMRATGTLTEVSVDSARERILKAVSDVPDVVSVEAQVKPVRGRADLDLDVEVLGEDVRLPEKQKEIDRALRQVINKQLGLQMAGRPRVRIRLHGEKPVVVPPRVEPPVVTPPPPVVVPPPEPEQKEPIFSSLRPEPEAEAGVEKPPPPPAPPAVEPKPEPREGLFSGLFRRDREDEVKPAPKPAEPAADEEIFADTPELAALLRTPKPDEPPPVEKPVTVVTTDEDEVDDEADTINLNLDRELSNTAVDDLVEDRPADEQDDDERPAAVTPDEPRQS